MKRVLKHSFHITRWTFGVLILIATLLLVAGRGASDYVEKYAEDIVGRLSGVLGVPVAVEGIDTDWRGLSPSVTLKGVSLGQGNDFTTIELLVVKPDVISSLMHWTIVWSHFEARGLVVEIDELPSGGWELAGIKLGTGDQGSRGGDYLENMVLESSLVSLEDASFRFTSLTGTQIDLEVGELSLVNSLGFHRLKLNADFGQAKNSIEFVSELNGTAAHFTELDGLAYLRIEGSDITEVYQYLTERFWPERDLRMETPPSLRSEFWMQFHANQDIRLQGQLELDAMPARVLGYDSGTAKAQSDLVASYSEHGLNLDFQNAVVELKDDVVELTDFRVERNIDADQVFYELWLPRMQMDELVASMAEVHAVPDRVLDLINRLNPRGALGSLNLRMPSSNLADWQINAFLDAISLESYGGAPAVENLTGWLQAGSNHGVINISSNDIGVQYPGVYEHWLRHELLQGNVAWSIDSDNQFVYVFSDDLVVESREGRVEGAFSVAVPTQPNYPTGVDLTLFLGLSGSSAEHADTLVPSSLPNNLDKWITDALVAGEIPEAGMIYRGSTKSGMEHLRTTQVRVQTLDTEFAFLDRWPSIREANAEVWVSNTDLYAEVPQARLFELSAIQTEVYLKPAAYSEKGAPPELFISSTVKGPANNGLDLVRKTSLRDAVGESLDDLNLLGGLNADVDIQLPIRNSLSRDDIGLDIRVDLSENELVFEDLGLSLTDLNGQIFLDGASMRSENMRARLWGAPISYEMFEEEGSGLLEIKAVGALDVANIYGWLEMPLLDSFVGETDFNADIKLYTDASLEKPNRYEFRTDLVGVRSDFPAPLSKPADLATSLLVRIEQDENLISWFDWRLPADSDGSSERKLLIEAVQKPGLQDPAGGFQSSRIAYQSDMPERRSGVLHGQIQLEEVDVEPWLELFANTDEADAFAGEYGTLLGLKPRLNFEIDDLQIGESEFGEVFALLDYEKGAWDLDLYTDYASGSYKNFEDEAELPLLSITHIDVNEYLERLEQTGAMGDGPVDPRQFPELRFEIKSVVLDEVNRGQWKGVLRPTETGLWIGNLEGGYESLTLSQEEGESSIFWGVDDNSQFTETNFTFDYEDIGDLFGLMNLETPMSSSNGLLYASLHWDGAPYEFSSAGLNGIMGIDARRGEFFTNNNNANALMKTIGLVNVSSWTRRLRLDFDDVTASGTYYNQLIGDFILEDDLVSTLTPVNVSLSSGSMLFDGQVDLKQESVDAKLVVTLPARQNMAWVAALVAGLPAAAGVWLASQVFDEELDSLSSVSYRVSGSMDSPKVEADKMFESTIK